MSPNMSAMFGLVGKILILVQTSGNFSPWAGKIGKKKHSCCYPPMEGMHVSAVLISKFWTLFLFFCKPSAAPGNWCISYWNSQLSYRYGEAWHVSWL